MFTYPIYAGLGPFPPLVDEDTWIDVAAKLIDEDGLDDFVTWVRGGLIAVGLNIPRFDPILAMRDQDSKTIAREVLKLCHAVN